MPYPDTNENAFTGQTVAAVSAVQITDNANGAGRNVMFRAHPANTGTIYIGVAGVTTSTGFPLLAGDPFDVEDFANAQKFYVVGNGTDKVCYVGTY